jgi:hypothetical protein
MSPTFYSILHVSTVILLTGFTFYVVGRAPTGSKKPWMILTGILSLVTLVAAVGLWHKVYQMAQLPWIWVKLFLWLWLSALAGLAWRQPERRGLWLGMLSAIVLVAVLLVYLKPALWAAAD